MLLFVPQITPRITYTFRVIFERILQGSISFTDNFETFSASNEPKIAYSPQKIETPVWIEATPLLFEEGITKQPIISEKWEDATLFFPTQSGAFPVDIIAVIFFLISRYEEYYEDHTLDKHGRFQCKQSVAYQLGWHRQLMAHRLAFALAKVVQTHYPQFEYSLPKYEELSTHDVDIAYQYKGKPWWRSFAAFTKALLQGRFQHAANYLKVVLRKNVDDPFDNYYREANQPIYFILTAPFGKYDKNISLRSKAFKDLMNYLKSFAEIGLHPSYYSSVNTLLIRKEKKCLEEIAEIKVTKSRQHFLRFCFPDTFRDLIDAGITDDYSLGWHDEAGFRASIAVPYPFFDLVKNEETAFLLHPLAFMDGIFSKEEELSVLHELRENTEKMGGNLIILTHNSPR